MTEEGFLESARWVWRHKKRVGLILAAIQTGLVLIVAVGTALGFTAPGTPAEKLASLQRGQTRTVQRLDSVRSDVDSLLVTVDTLANQVGSLVRDAESSRQVDEIQGVKLCNEDARVNPWMWADLQCAARLAGVPRVRTPP